MLVARKNEFSVLAIQNLFLGGKATDKLKLKNKRGYKYIK